MDITVIGCGYVGLVTGACLAHIGHVVVCADNNRGKIEDLNRGRLPIYEAGLDAVVSQNRRLGRLSFSADLGQAVRHGETIFICVGTPPSHNGDGDVSAINRVAQSIATEAQSPKLVVEKSTVPVQTGWAQFKYVDWSRIQRAMNRPLLLDCCNLLDVVRMRELEFEYYSVGRPGTRAQDAAVLSPHAA